jgi:ribosome biogenesis GTPase
MARRKLSKQQRERIARIQDARREAAAKNAESALRGAGPEDQREGRVVVRHGRNLLVRDAEGRTLHCLFRQNLGEIVCGDRVLWQPVEGGEGVVVALQPRATSLSRPDYSGRDKPIAANITQLVVVLAPRPEPSGYLLDQYLVTAELIGVHGAICLNKADLLDEAARTAFRERFAHYRELGYPLIQVSAKTEHGLDPLLALLRNDTSILVGQSGVGKSSLINALLPSHELEEGALSDATGLGRHTTSAATLYQLDSGGEIIDSPGVRSFRLGRLSREQLEDGFPELRALRGRCRFSNCSHRQEPDCVVREALQDGRIHPDRLASFHHLAEGMAER